MGGEQDAGGGQLQPPAPEQDPNAIGPEPGSSALGGPWMYQQAQDIGQQMQPFPRAQNQALCLYGNEAPAQPVLSASAFQALVPVLPLLQGWWSEGYQAALAAGGGARLSS